LSLISFSPLVVQASTTLVSSVQYDAKSICHNVAKALEEDWDACESEGPKIDEQGTTEFVFMTDEGERACRVWTTNDGGQKGFLSPAPINADECPIGTFFTVKPISEEEHNIDITFGG